MTGRIEVRKPAALDGGQTEESQWWFEAESKAIEPPGSTQSVTFSSSHDQQRRPTCRPRASPTASPATCRGPQARRHASSYLRNATAKPNQDVMVSNGPITPAHGERAVGKRKYWPVNRLQAATSEARSGQARDVNVSRRT
jgi:hypothetical protein